MGTADGIVVEGRSLGGAVGAPEGCADDGVRVESAVGAADGIVVEGRSVGRVVGTVKG